MLLLLDVFAIGIVPAFREPIQMMNLDRSFRAVLLALALLLFLPCAKIRAQVEDRPIAGSAEKHLERFAGVWRYTGILHDTELGPGGKFTGTETNRLILDGLFLQSQGEDKGTYGGKEVIYKFLSIRSYDAARKHYRYESYDNDGVISHATVKLEGDKWVGTGSMKDSKGREFQTRTTSEFSQNSSNILTKGELSADGGKTWKPYWETTSKKARQE